MGNHMALAANNLLGGGSVGRAIGRVGRDDSVVLVHQDERVGMGINHGLQLQVRFLFVGHFCTPHGLLIVTAAVFCMEMNAASCDRL